MFCNESKIGKEILTIQPFATFHSLVRWHSYIGSMYKGWVQRQEGAGLRQRVLVGSCPCLGTWRPPDYGCFKKCVETRRYVSMELDRAARLPLHSRQHTCNKTWTLSFSTVRLYLITVNFTLIVDSHISLLV